MCIQTHAYTHIQTHSFSHYCNYLLILKAVKVRRMFRKLNLIEEFKEKIKKVEIKNAENENKVKNTGIKGRG